MKIVATIEARMSSSRLPGKVLLEAGAKPMLGHLIDRMKRAPSLNEICVATTTNGTDDLLVESARSNGVSSFRGSEEDVMLRVLGAAESCAADVIVEITGDCPIIDPRIVEQAIRMYRNNDCDYVTNGHIRSYPDGMDVDVFSLAALRRSAAMTNDPLDHEHVKLHMRTHPDLFRTVHLVAPPRLHWPELGLVLDEPRDYELLKKVIEHFGPENPYFSCREAVELLHEHPGWISINRDVYRKGYE